MELRDEDATRAFGRSVAGALRGGDVVFLEGELGAGKTFLVRSIARGLGVPADIPVTSPTFTLLHELPGAVAVVHADVYRLDRADDLVEIGLLEKPGEGAVVLVEWGERFADALPPDVVIRLETTGDTSRRATLEPRSPRGSEIAAVLSR